MCWWACLIAHKQQESIFIAKVKSRCVRWFAVVISVSRFPWRRSENEGCALFPLSSLPSPTFSPLLRPLLGYYSYWGAIDCKTVGFLLKLSKEIGKAWLKSLTRASRKAREKKRLSPVSLSVFSLVPHLSFDCSRVLEYAKIWTVCSVGELWMVFIAPQLS